MTKQELDEEYASRLLAIQRECDHRVEEWRPTSYGQSYDLHAECRLCGAVIGMVVRFRNNPLTDRADTILSWWRQGSTLPIAAVIYDSQPGLLPVGRIEQLYRQVRQTDYIRKLCDRLDDLLAREPMSRWLQLLAWGKR